MKTLVGRLTLLAFAMTMCGGTAAAASAPPAAPAKLQAALDSDIRDYLAKYKSDEHISTVSLAISLHGQAPITMAVGTTEYGAGAPATPKTMFQIGSITKSFTAVAILHLEAQGLLSIHDTVGKWLPQYPQWKAITIQQLLDMTSGIVTYDNDQPMQRYWAAHPYHYFSPKALIDWVTKLPRKEGYYYSNTAYQMCDLIVEKASGKSYTDVVRGIIADAHLDDAYFYDDIYPVSIQQRMAAGYFVAKEPVNLGLYPLLGKDMRPYSLSWAQAAGGIVASPAGVLDWVRDLYTGSILEQAQRTELETLISTKTGKPLASVTPEDPGGFGLGVVHMLKEPLGEFWFYEGSTIGYRVAYAYFPKYDAVIAIGLNSAPVTDHIGPLLATIFGTLKGQGAL